MKREWTRIKGLAESKASGECFLSGKILETNFKSFVFINVLSIMKKNSN